MGFSPWEGVCGGTEHLERAYVRFRLVPSKLSGAYYSIRVVSMSKLREGCTDAEPTAPRHSWSASIQLLQETRLLQR